MSMLATTRRAVTGMAVVVILCSPGAAGCRSSPTSDDTRPPGVVGSAGGTGITAGEGTAAGTGAVSTEPAGNAAPVQDIDVDVVAGGRIHVTSRAVVGVAQNHYVWVHITLAGDPGSEEFLAHLVVEPAPSKAVFVSSKQGHLYSSVGFGEEEEGPFSIALTAGLSLGQQTLAEDFSFTIVRTEAPQVSVELVGVPWSYDYCTQLGFIDDSGDNLLTYVPAGPITLRLMFGEPVDRPAVEAYLKDLPYLTRYDWKIDWESETVAQVSVDVPPAFRRHAVSLVSVNLNGMVPVPGKAPLHDLRIWHFVGTVPAHLVCVSGEGSSDRKVPLASLPFAMAPADVSPEGDRVAAFADTGTLEGEEAEEIGTLPWVAPTTPATVSEALRQSYSFSSIKAYPCDYRFLAWAADGRLLLGSLKTLMAADVASRAAEPEVLQDFFPADVVSFALSYRRDTLAALTQRPEPPSGLGYDLWTIDLGEAESADSASLGRRSITLTGLPATKAPQQVVWLPTGEVGVRVGPRANQGPLTRAMGNVGATAVLAAPPRDELYWVDRATGEVRKSTFTGFGEGVADTALTWTYHDTEAEWLAKGLVLTSDGKLWSRSSSVTLTPWLNPVKAAFSPDYTLLALEGRRNRGDGSEPLVQVYECSTGAEIDSYPGASLCGWSDDGRLWLMQPD